VSLATACLAVLIAVAPLSCRTSDDSADLRLVLRTAGGERDEYKLKCDPPGGTVPNPRGLCDALAEHSKTMLAQPAEGLCSMGVGSLFVDVEGRFRGKDVKTSQYICGGNGEGLFLWIRRGRLPVPPS